MPALSAAGRRRDARAPVPRALGPANAQALLRTFDSAAGDSNIRVVLYRDRHAWCPYCQKVWMQLEEKRIPYRVEKINMRCYGKKSREYQRLVPSGMLPALELDGSLVLESDAIMSKLEQAFPDHRSLVPSDPKLLNLATKLLKLERYLFSVWCGWLCRSGGEARNKAQFIAALDEVDRALTLVKPGPFFLGSDVMLVDCVFVPFLERMSASLLYYKGLRIKGHGSPWPNITRWFDALESRPSYQGIRSDWHTHVHDLPPQLGGCHESGTHEQFSAARKLDSWTLPLDPLSSKSLEPVPRGYAERADLDRQEAAIAVVRFKDSLVQSAILAHDRSSLRNSSKQSLDAALRMICEVMLDVEEKAGGGAEALRRAIKASSEIDTSVDGASVALSLRHLRDRVNVPRDMGFPAARQLRAHMDALANILDPEHTSEPDRITKRHRYDQDPARFFPSGL